MGNVCSENEGDEKCVIYFSLFIVSTSLLIIVSTCCTVAWSMCYCLVYKKRFDGRRRIKSFRKRGRNGVEYTARTEENGNMVDLSLELLEGEFGPRDEDNTVQPYEVPQTMFPRTPDTRGDGPRPATQNITDTIIYDEPMKEDIPRESNPDTKMGTSTNLPNDRAATTNKQGSHLVTMATEETVIYEDPDQQNVKSEENEKTRMPLDSMTTPEASKEPHSSLTNPRTQQKVQDKDYCEPVEIKSYITQYEKKRNSSSSIPSSSSSSSSSSEENENNPIIIHEIHTPGYKEASSAYHQLGPIDVRELQDTDDALYENIQMRTVTKETSTQAGTVGATARVSYYNFEDIQECSQDDRVDPLQGKSSHTLMSTGYQINTRYQNTEGIYEFETGKVWEPEGNARQIHKEMSLRRYPILEAVDLIYLKSLGEGEFGEVYKGEWTIDDNVVQVAVKELKESASEEARAKLLKEAALMGQFNHKHVIKLFGVVNEGEQVLLIMEYLKGGDIRNYLESTKKQPSRLSSLAKQLLKFCTQIADAMAYLSGRGFIHRDLAARNILLDEHMQCKIADFGMSRDLEGAYYYKSKGGRIPLKWTAPEAILYRKYSTKSDVWSYGMVMYEIWSLGCEPFEALKVQEVINMFDTGFCQAPPPGCPRQIYHMMIKCWHPDAHQRPTFNDLLYKLQTNASTLLRWEEKDNTGPEAATLGAPLQYGATLHQDLQQMYQL